MTKESLAALLNGREYCDEISGSEEREAKASGLIVIFGSSDDNVELRGAFNDEIVCYGGDELFLRSCGVMDVTEAEDCSRCRRRMIETKKLCAKVELLWCKEPDYSWTYKTSLPHATFEIVEDGEKFCRGIVISRNDLPVVED